MAAQPPPSPARHLPIRLLLLTLLIASLLVLLFLVDQQVIRLPTNDFTMYWSSAKLLLSGANPYDPAGLADYQRQEINRDADPVLMYYPPWSMVWIIPFGLLEHDISQVIWLLIQTAVILLCTNQVWLHIGGANRYRWIAWVAAFIFGPTFAALGYTGQITPLLLLGFSYFYINMERPDRDWLGGLFVLLIGIKPQVFYLFFVLFVIWALHQRRWRLLISALISVIIATILSMCFDHQITSHYLQNLSENTPSAWATPTIGTYLRYYLGIGTFEKQFIPAILTSVLGILYWWKKRNSWSWQESMPWVLLISVATTPYTWTYDFLPLIIPLLLGFAWIVPQISHPHGIILIILYGLTNFAYWWLHLHYSDFYFIWFAPVMFIWFIMANRIANQKTVRKNPINLPAR